MREEERFSTTKSYQDAMDSLIRNEGREDIFYLYINKDEPGVINRALAKFNRNLKMLKGIAGRAYNYSISFASLGL